MNRIAKKVAVKATAVAVGSVAVTLLIARLVTFFAGGSVDGAGLVLCILCPLAIAGPCSAVQFWQQERLEAARAALITAGQRLEQLHLDLQIAHAALAEKSRIDDMTGALNREAFLALLEETIGRGRSGALLFIDADHFKAINDTHGHLAGDAALRAIAAAIRSAIPAQDAFGRIGGEEFAVLLSGADETKAGATADRMRRMIQEITLSSDDGADIPLTISIGGACYNAGCDIAALWRQADQLLYQAKRAGRNRSVIAGRAAA